MNSSIESKSRKLSNARLSKPEELDAFSKIRLSRHFLMRDFLYSSSATVRGIANTPEDPEMTVRAGKALCERVLEPLLTRFGPLAITFGYQCRQALDCYLPASARKLGPTSSNPHQWDRGTFGDAIYARVDVLPYAVEDGEVSRDEVGRWMMYELDIDLLMQWSRSNVFCITIGPKPRRVWLQWGDASLGEMRRTVFMGADFWQWTYPTLPAEMRPRFGPSHTGGSIRWSKT